MPKETSFVHFLDLNGQDRRRHYHVHERGRVLDFVEQYETLIEGGWVPIVRYDTSHGQPPHRDLYHPDGTRDKMYLSFSDYNEALTYAQQDIRKNWPQYKAQYLREKEQKP